MDEIQSDYAIYRQVVDQLLQDQEQLPSLPMLTLDIRRALATPEVSMTRLLTLIGKDPALSALLVKYASNPLQRTRIAPKTLQDVVRVLGMQQVDRVVMMHSVKSLFVLQSLAHKQLFMGAWQRLTLKASLCGFLARALGPVPADQAVLASLLSDVGALAVLSAFKDSSLAPSPARYRKLCRRYGQSLGVMLLKKWAVDEQYVQVVRALGDWRAPQAGPLQLVDLVNLGHYHVLNDAGESDELPALAELTAHAKLRPPLDEVATDGGLAHVSRSWDDIHALAAVLS